MERYIDPEREKRIADLRSKLETLGCQLNLAKELSADSEGHRLRFTLDYVSEKISESDDNQIDLDSAENKI